MATGRPKTRPTCPGCGKPMPVRYEKRRETLANGETIDVRGEARVGYNGEGKFCSLQCAYQFACVALDMIEMRGGAPSTIRLKHDNLQQLGRFLDVTA